jgi:hypothetical protein
MDFPIETINRLRRAQAAKEELEQKRLNDARELALQTQAAQKDALTLKLKIAELARTKAQERQAATRETLAAKLKLAEIQASTKAHKKSGIFHHSHSPFEALGALEAKKCCKKENHWQHTVSSQFLMVSRNLLNYKYNFYFIFTFHYTFPDQFNRKTQSDDKNTSPLEVLTPEAVSEPVSNGEWADFAVLCST